MTEASFLMSFGDTSAHLCPSGPRAAELTSLFSGITPAPKEASAKIRFSIRDDDEALSLWCNDGVVLRRASAHDALYELASLLGYHLVDPCTNGLMLHSAAVSRHGRALVLPGASLSGKSTLTAWLLAHGYDYQSDELVHIPLGTNTVAGFGRPLHIRGAAQLALACALGRATNNDNDNFVPCSEFGSQFCSSSEISTLIFPHFEANATARLCRLTKGQTTLQLMQCLTNARNLSRYGASEAARLAQAIPAYSLSYGGFLQLEALLSRIFSMSEPRDGADGVQVQPQRSDR